MNQTRDNHTALVLDLAKTPGEIMKDIDLLKIDMLHGAIGLAGEGIEFMVGYLNGDWDNMKEEAGDLLFYGRMLEIRLGVTLGDGEHMRGYDEPCNKDDWMHRTVTHCGNVLDLVKKMCIYNKKGLEPEIEEELGKAYWCLKTVCGIEFTLDEARQHNITKLRKRYAKGGYSDQQAQDRADKAGNEASGD